MESTGVPERIQISEEYSAGLAQNYPEFKVTLRGYTEIKVGPLTV